MPEAAHGALVVAIDGPAASGKGTLARRLADLLHFAHLDTGSLYRAVGLAVIRAGGDPGDAAAATAAPQTEVPVEEGKADIREEVVDASVTEGDFGPDSARTNADGSAPAGFDVKGNKDSMKYHVPGSRWYDSTEAEVWFRSADAAKAAGFEPAGGEAAQKMA